MAEQSVNVPQVLIFVVVIFLVSRWYLSKSGDAAPGTRAAANRATEGHRMGFAEERRECGCNDGAGVEWEGFGHCTTFFPNTGPRRTTSPPASARAAAPAKPAHPDLITRYNLSSKISQTEQPAQEGQPKAKSWSADKNERQANLQRRREEMILAARRKLEEQEKAKASSPTA
ncbi:hypothetical protein P3342_007779 [Pyrenophora teres f. teres]|nr:hypothetical protein P3342_007779 [Pyrenophora teres f. teres]